MALFRPDEECWDLPMSSKDGSPHVSNVVANIIYVVFGFLFTVLWRPKNIGLENVRSFKGVTGAVLVGNHASYLDPVFMWLAVRLEQWVRFMGRDDLFPKGKGILGFLITRVGGFPVKRDSADRTAIKRAANYLKMGECVGIFPEGTRRGKSNKTPELHSGAAFIARMGGQAPLVPFTIRGIEKIKQKGKMPSFHSVTTVFGNPVLLSDFDFLPKEDRLDGATWYVVRECYALNRNVAAVTVDMNELFPGSKDFGPIFLEHPIPVRSAKDVAAQIKHKKDQKKMKSGIVAAGQLPAGNQKDE